MLQKRGRKERKNVTKEEGIKEGREEEKKEISKSQVLKNKRKIKRRKEELHLTSNNNNHKKKKSSTLSYYVNLSCISNENTNDLWTHFTEMRRYNDQYQ